ncbi:hypothetical protein [Gilvibacter sediminis]|uniref:hypothetical protein n=1 Tax=Gilvibacter sediminis TaxID=379071 RepID=UPI0023506172|nr:hypothetical protein [Gilvibacter sediminis]MDC7997379.1 hypothetical protein [Gilvibacter sediminis]
MKNLLIKQVKYIGSDYLYESPILTKGINILEGENGSGKTTFSSLIYFGFGGNVKWFKKDNINEHKQITDDNSNYVELTIEIDDEPFVLSRYFYKNEINIVGTDEVQSLPVNRGPKKDFTFSDWILNKLNIKVVDIYQGTEFYKINFYDLARLFYHDQNTSSDRIYKRPDSENFITDSAILKKAIFEILTGNSFEEYYTKNADYRKALNERTALNGLISNFDSINLDSTELYDSKNVFTLKNELQELIDQLIRLEDYRESINSNVESSKSNTEIISSKRRSYIQREEQLLKLKQEKKSLVLDYRKVSRLHEDLILEVTQMKKIMIANERLDLFSPDTCPYCLQKAKREKNTCICGNTVTDEQYQKFFYSKEEYFNILKSKQKNIDTVNQALESYSEDIRSLDTKIALFDMRLAEQKTEINQLVRGRKIVKNQELKEINNKIINLEKAITGYRQQIKIEEKRASLDEQKNSIELKIQSIKRDLESLKNEAGKSMDSVIANFNKKYFSLMEKALYDCRSARISPDDYMPIINSGAYKEASSNVSKRLMYFFTLLDLSLTFNIKYPKFLLIDTPENMGIDDNDLIKMLRLINEIGTDQTGIQEAQIILTTGQNKYPKEMDSKVFQRITKQNRLLQKRTYDVIN